MAALQPGGSPGASPPAIGGVSSPTVPDVSPTVDGSAAITPTLEPTSDQPIQPTLDATVAPQPTQADPPTAAPVEPLPTIVLPTPPALNNEERWRAQQIERTVFEPPQTYTTAGSDLWWYDPLNQQSIILGTIAGDFTVQAEFVLRSQGRDALEVPYQVNQSYGLTALSPAILERIAAAGYSDWIETYVFRGPNVIRR